MSSNVGVAPRKSNLAGDTFVTRKGQFCHLTELIMRVAQGLFRTKVVQHIASIAKASERTVKRWRSGRNQMGVEEFARLLRTEEGVLYLTAVMADSKAAWWRMFCAQLDKVEAQRLQAKARHRLRRAVMGGLEADAELTAAINRAEVLAFQDEDFAGPHVDALRSFGRVSNSAVAQAQGKRK